MMKFEYKCVNIACDFKDILKTNKSDVYQKIQTELNNLGSDGWELVAVEGSWFYLKKQLD
jgi:hypothetical protein